MRIDTDASLAALTTLRVGGQAQRLLVAGSDDEVVEAVRDAGRARRPLLVIGDGSNVVVGAAGFDGDVLQIDTQGIRVVDRDERHVEIIAAAGMSWDDVVAHCVDNGWGGVETLSGIPGRTGATPIQNVGAYGAEVSDVLREVTVLDRTAGSVRTLSDDACRFGYRTSRFKAEPQHHVVLGVRLRLTLDGRSLPVRYTELAQALGVELESRASVDDVRAAVLDIRRRKAMVLDDTDHDTWSVGSFFTNPVVTSVVADSLPAQAPRFPQADGRIKTSAAWLIQQSGFGPGFPGPDAPARLSTRHVLAITNRGRATTDDLLALARQLRDAVWAEFGIELVPEPVFVGCAM